MISSRDINLLRPRTQVKAIAFQTTCREAGRPILIYQTLRDAEYQDQLYAQGRTKPGKIVTNAKGGSSFHEYGVAIDFVPLVEGLPAWNDDKGYQRCAQIGKACGFEWGGDFKSFKDQPHLQDTMGFTIADYAAGKAPP